MKITLGGVILTEEEKLRKRMDELATLSDPLSVEQRKELERIIKELKSLKTC